MNRRWWFAEVLIGVYLTVAVFSLGWGISILGGRSNAVDAVVDSGDIPEPPQPTGMPLLTADNIIAIFTVIMGVATVYLVADGRSHSRHALRAYVLASSCRLKRWTDHGAVFEVDIKNFGQTPAYQATIWGGGRSRTIPVSNLRDTRPSDIPFSHSAIGPGESRVTEVIGNFSAEHKREMEMGKRIFFVIGDVAYRDAFRRKRQSTFRFAMGAEYGMPDTESGELTVSYEGNDAD